MNGATMPKAAVATLHDWPALETGRGKAYNLLSWMLASAMFAVVAWQMLDFGYAELAAMLPRRPGFYFALIALYLALPISETFIFRRVWHVPATVVVPLLRKTVINDLVISYGGEIALYAWARRRLRNQVAPFGAIKDVSILSAVVGNLVTLAMLLATLPWLRTLVSSDMAAPAIGSALVVLAVPLLALVFGRRVFSLSRQDLRFVAVVHLLRLVASMVLMAWMWSSVLPSVAFTYWLALQAVRLLVSRLPLVPNKDMMFASLAVLMVGHDSAIAALVSLTAMALLAMHLLCFALLILCPLLKIPRTQP